MTPMITRPLSPLAPGVPFVRYMKGTRYGAEYARGTFADSPQVAHALEVMRTKAVVGGMTADENPDLVQLGIIDSQTRRLLAGQSAFEACRDLMREVPFQVPAPRQTDAGTGGGWVLEGRAKPVVRFAFDTLRLAPVACASIFVCSEELLRSPQAELVVRDAALGAVGRTESDLFLNPALGPSGNAPGSITYNAPAGSFSAAAMLAQITTSGRGLAFVGRLPDLAGAAAIGGSGYGIAATDLPRSILGIPIIVCPNAPIGQITLVDFSEVVYAATPLDVERSDEASVEMDSAPAHGLCTGSPLAPSPTSLVSLYQTNSVGFKLSRFLNWSVVREGAVVVGYVSYASTGSPA